MPRTRPPLLLPATLLLALLAGACEEEIQRGLTEAEAQELLVTLEAAGLRPAASHAGREGWSLRVPEAEAPAARRALLAQGLPRPREEEEPTGGLLPLPAEERRRSAAAQERRLEGSLRRLPGVVDARVHLTLPAPAHRLPGAPAPAPQAAILLRLQPGAASPEADARRLVSGAVEGLEAPQIEVVAREAALPAPLPAEALPWDEVGPLRVAPGSRGAAQGIFGGLLGVILLQSAAIAWLVVRRRRAAPP